MSRVGKAPIQLPKGVDIDVSKGNLVTVKGPKGQLQQKIDPDLTLEMNDGVLEIKRPTDQKRHREVHGLFRALINNMVTGVSEGYIREMEIFGVGFRAASNGQWLELSLGYSHPILFRIPQEIKIETRQDKGQNPIIKLECIDKELLGQVCAKIRSLRKPEPYKGKGIRFVGEEIRRKAGKTSGKK
ncbi:50S ribosomal protein L6 [Haliscomenobacter sp.]|uniref:50S ribosomal protein L6 n=1 Tax=Haliscomenobacter sp. TaxID=2717303 RepID=UPI003364EFFA